MSLNNNEQKRTSMTSTTKSSSIVLASASPRRSELLTLARIPFTVVPADIDESVHIGETPTKYALRLAEEKAKAAAGKAGVGRYFIGADTIVVLEGVILGKPVDEDEAFSMLTSLSGRTHAVITGICVYDCLTGDSAPQAVTTTVTFTDLTEQDIKSYVATGCPMDKAGAYAIQGGAASFVERIDGSYTNVVGLPTCELVRLLRSLGVDGGGK